MGVPGTPGGIADSIMEAPGVNSEVIFLGWNLGLWRVQAGREHLQDSDGVNESFWDGHGVEIEARQFLTFRHGMRCRHVMT